MPVLQRTSTVLRRGAVGLLVGGVILVMVLVEARQDHPGKGAAPSCGTHRPTRPTGRWFAVAPWGWRRSGESHPTRPGSRAARCSCGNARTDPGCGSAPISSPRPRWSGTAAYQAFGTGQIARPAIWMTPPTRCSSRMEALCFGDLGLLYGCSGVPTAPSTVAPSFEGLPTRLVSP
jgi:hypothetical protein